MTDGKDPITGRFTAGNRFWTARSTKGPKPLFANGDELRAAAVEYFEWNDANPLMASELVKYEGRATVAEVPKMRAMTLKGLYQFLDVTIYAWIYWREARPDLHEAMDWIESVIYRQKFEGAAADMMNQAIIARELGLAEKQEISGTVKAEVVADAAFQALAGLLGSAIPRTEGSNSGADSVADDSEA